MTRIKLLTVGRAIKRPLTRATAGRRWCGRNNLSDDPWKLLIIAAVVFVLFGTRKLPDAARSLGKLMRILKTEVAELHDDERTQ